MNRLVFLIVIVLTTTAFKNPPFEFTGFMQDFRWQKRVIILIDGPSENSVLSTFESLYENQYVGLQQRDLIVLHYSPETCAFQQLLFSRGQETKTRPIGCVSSNQFKSYLRLADKWPAMMLIGKDGTDKLADQKIIHPKTLFAVIDRMPMRRQEMKNQR